MPLSPGHQTDTVRPRQHFLIHFQRHSAAVRRVFHRIGQQIHIDLPQQHRVCHDPVIPDIVQTFLKAQASADADPVHQQT